MPEGVECRRLSLNQSQGAQTLGDDRASRGACAQPPSITLRGQMEVDGPSTSEQPQVAAAPVFSVNVLQIVRDAQSIHGLKHSDYQRYRQAQSWLMWPAAVRFCALRHRSCCLWRRQYCTRRLRRIYEGVRFLHGRGRYQKKKLDPDHVKDER